MPHGPTNDVRLLEAESTIPGAWRCPAPEIWELFPARLANPLCFYSPTMEEEVQSIGFFRLILQRRGGKYECQAT
jgi:hypothetical protein